MNATLLQQFTSIEDAIASLFGSQVKITGMDRVSGGDINQAYRLALSDGTYIFMKSNKKENISFFAAEAEGLSAIAKTGMIRVPRILCGGVDEGGMNCSFLLMEFIEGKKRVKDYWEAFAYQLAAMHRAGTSDFTVGGIFGFSSDNFIGAGKQMNKADDSWVSFFRGCRLEPQFKKAFPFFEMEGKRKALKLLDRIDRILVEPEYPSLLHGDLWSGNVMTGRDGGAWLIDPAVYVGHAEADIAMTELFGGFPPAFYDAYREAAPMQPGYGRRRSLYHLYHLLNHLNMFGRAYLPSVMDAIEEYF